jgi:hypothetical protein
MRQLARALQTVRHYVHLILTKQLDWATTSFTDYTLFGNRSHIIHAQASSQAIHISPGSLVEDTIPFKTALTLSLIAIVVIIGQIRGCFLLDKFRPW